MKERRILRAALMAVSLVATVAVVAITFNQPRPLHRQLVLQAVLTNDGRQIGLVTDFSAVGVYDVDSDSSVWPTQTSARASMNRCFQTKNLQVVVRRTLADSLFEYDSTARKLVPGDFAIPPPGSAIVCASLSALVAAEHLEEHRGSRFAVFDRRLGKLNPVATLSYIVDQRRVRRAWPVSESTMLFWLLPLSDYEVGEVVALPDRSLLGLFSDRDIRDTFQVDPAKGDTDAILIDFNKKNVVAQSILKSGVLSLNVVRTGRFVVAGGEDHLEIRKLPSFEITATTATSVRCLNVAVNLSGTVAAFSAKDVLSEFDSLFVWDVRSGAVESMPVPIAALSRQTPEHKLFSFPSDNGICLLEFSDDSTLVCVTGSGHVLSFDVNRRKCIRHGRITLPVIPKRET